MVAKAAKKTEPEPEVCDNHPDRAAVHVTDGEKFEVKRFCKTCLDRWHRALTGPRRG